MSSKANLPQSERAKLAAKKQAMPTPGGGRFPITNAVDLDNAIRAVGRAKGGEVDRNAVRRFIIRRAKALGLSSKIPDTWDQNTGALKS